MSKEQNSRQLLVATMLSLVVAACSHTTSPSAQINSGFAPFSSTRNQTVGLVANTKHSLGASDVNTLDVAYTALQEKANAYASFMVEAITTSSFDPAKNAKYAADLTTAIRTLTKALQRCRRRVKSASRTSGYRPSRSRYRPVGINTMAYRQDAAADEGRSHRRN